MAKDPAFLFYPNDYLGGTLGMTFEEKGAYMELLMVQFNRGHMTSQVIGQVVGQTWVKIQDKFKKDSEGNFYNERLEWEVNKRKRFVESRFNNISGKNQYSKKVGHKEGHMSSHMENENEDENINKDELIKKREIKFKSEVYEFAEKYPEVMLDKFCNYWTEKNKSGTKMRWELERVFEISRRLATWASRDKEIVKEDKLFTHREMLDLTKDNPEKWKDFETITIDSKAFYKPKY